MSGVEIQEVCWFALQLRLGQLLFLSQLQKF